jgi:hypothetical protein
MGNAVSTSPSRNSRLSTSSDNGRSSTGKVIREHKRNGVVVVKLNSSAASRRGGDGQITHVVTPKGAILYGSLFNPTGMQRAITSSGYPMLAPGELAIPDSRAHRLLVTYCHGWHLIPFPEVFSRHSGTCFVVGDRNNTGAPFQIRVGDCFRLGSVGLVVSEMKLIGQDEQRLDARTLQFLKDEALAFDTNEDLAALASDEIAAEEQDFINTECEVDHTNYSHSRHAKGEEAMSVLTHGDDDDDGSLHDQQSQSQSPSSPQQKQKQAVIDPNGGGIASGERFFCYMCYENHNTPEDPLIAPCDCRGDTRFLHVQCLQKWYHSSALGSHAQVIRTTGNGAPACKICGAAYKTNFRRADGRKTSILEMENNGPYLSLVVVTHHDTNPGLFNTKFRLNFGRHDAVNNSNNNVEEVQDANTIVIGRSSSCTMILDYRTVSTVHAKITYANGRFYLSDNRSSNGTLVYLQDPLPLSFSQPVKIRMGRTTLSLQAKRSWSSALRAFVFGSSSTGDDAIPAAEQLTQTLGTTQTVVHSTSIDYSGCEAPTPNDLQALIATLTSTLADKEAAANTAVDGGNGVAGGPSHAFLNRSYTARTLNDHDHEHDVSADNDDIYGAAGGLDRSSRMMLEHGGYIPPNDMILTAGQQQPLQYQQSRQGNNGGGSNRLSSTTRFMVDDDLMIMPRRHEDVDDDRDLNIYASNSPLSRPYRIDPSSTDGDDAMMMAQMDTRSDEEVLRDVLALSNMEFQQYQQQQQQQSAKGSPVKAGEESPRPMQQPQQQLSRNGSQGRLNAAIRAQTPPSLALGLLSGNGNGDHQGEGSSSRSGKHSNNSLNGPTIAGANNTLVISSAHDAPGMDLPVEGAAASSLPEMIMDEKRENMFNSLPVAGKYAVPGRSQSQSAVAMNSVITPQTPSSGAPYSFAAGDEITSAVAAEDNSVAAVHRSDSP